MITDSETEMLVFRLLALREQLACIKPQQRGVRDRVAALQSEAVAIGQAIVSDRERCQQQDQQARAAHDSGMRKWFPGYTPPRRRPFAYALDEVRRG